MSSGAAKVQQTTLCQDNHAMTVREDVAIHLWLDVLALDAGEVFQAKHVDLIVKVTDVTHDGIVLHLGHVLSHDDVAITGGRDEDISGLQTVFQRTHGKAFHSGLQGTDGIDLRHNHLGSSSLHGKGTALPNVTVPSDESSLACKHHIGGPHNTVREGVAASVQVVELTLGHRIVHVDGGEKESAVLHHLIEPLHTSGGLLGNSDHPFRHAGPALGVLGKALLDDGEDNLELRVVSGGGIWQGAILGVHLFCLLALVDQKSCVAAIVHDHVRALAVLPAQGLLRAPPVLLQRLSLPGKNGSRVSGNCCSGMILGRIDVA
mmetsp:Transcript_4554/g.16238  ORF Transcript_4554/g.16238 Transcript_4554/m.16238 type:complete len:319 (-) Transcript_4554:321-1277(-)